MKQIAFKNFRKFADLPPMDLAPITVLVGENNAGKSTVVKGILAFSDFLKKRSSINLDDLSLFEEDSNLSGKQRNDSRKRTVLKYLQNVKFFFNTSYLAHIGTFKRALYNKTDDNSITFKAKIGYTTLGITVTGNPRDEEAVSANVTEIEILWDRINVSMNFNLVKDLATVRFYPQSDSDNDFIEGDDQTRKYFDGFNKQYSFEMTISDYWLSLYQPDIIRALLTCVETAINVTIFPTLPEGRYLYLSPRLERAMEMCPSIRDISDETLEFIKYFCRCFSTRRDEKDYPQFRLHMSQRMSLSEMVDIEYIYAHAVTQTVVYSAKDTNDYLSHTIHEYAPLDRSAYKHKFIANWMREFGVGNDFSIKSVGGEAHIVYIQNSDGQKVNLADKGMGSIQLMVLLFRLAISLTRSNNDRRRIRITNENRSIFIIEEPEQNLHPMLQSKLADLFFELNTKYGFRFIIETHSEYLVRRSQVIVGENFSTENRLSRNPFKVYYFPSEGDPYDMVYTTSGLFEKKFGDGFINEAGKLHMAILKNAKKNQ